MHRKTIVASGSLTARMRRHAAARAGEVGTDIVTLPLLAARLAGGFLRPASQAELLPPIIDALATLDFEELEPVKDTPGMARAVLASLSRLWTAGRVLVADDGSPRLRDLARIEAHVRERLPTATLLPPDLCAAAISRTDRAKSILGAVHFHRLIEIDMIWRPLVHALVGVLDLTWEAASVRDRHWFPGNVFVAPTSPRGDLICDVCADPRAEVVEALRWARALLSDGTTQAADIAIVSADTSAWDDHMAVLSGDADLPMHFASGRPAMSTRIGQTCAALADIMINGLAQDRVRRLSLLSPYLAEALPANWMVGIPDDAVLFDYEHWRRALSASSAEVSSVLLPVIELLSRGPSAAAQLGATLLRGPSLGLWQEALRLAPAPAMEMTLGSLRIADERDPASSIVWAAADDMVGAPRQHMRLIGLASRSWPRADVEDPLLPDHLIDWRTVVPFPRLERDRTAFEILTTHPRVQVSLSRSKRSGEGALLAKSALLQQRVIERTLSRTRMPEQAFSEGDRLLARAHEANELARVQRASTCWVRGSRQFETTPHDGLTRSNHPAILRALGRPQSATSLRRMLRDPLGFVWRYVLGMTAPEIALRPLQLDARTFGTLVHELLRIAVDELEPTPGLVGATTAQIDDALATAAGTIADAWPLRQAVPPRLLWLDTIAEARRRAYRGLTLDERFGPGTRSWSEIDFGAEASVTSDVEPWPPHAAVAVGTGRIRLRGRIDRIDVKSDRRSARMTDYKTGNTPRNLRETFIGGGVEVQRTIYSLAIRQLIPEVTQVISRLAYLESGEPPFELKGEELERAEEVIVRYIDIAVDQLTSGGIVPGPDAFERFSELRLALPANLDGYRARKDEGFQGVLSKLAPLWSEP